jgi:hypothetical protein
MQILGSPGHRTELPMDVPRLRHRRRVGRCRLGILRSSLSILPGTLTITVPRPRGPVIQIAREKGKWYPRVIDESPGFSLNEL